MATNKETSKHCSSSFSARQKKIYLQVLGRKKDIDENSYVTNLFCLLRLSPIHTFDKLCQSLSRKEQYKDSSYESGLCLSRTIIEVYVPLN